jgi:hypothetical protein
VHSTSRLNTLYCAKPSRYFTPVIMILRIYALYGANALVLICLALVLMAEMTLMGTTVYFMQGEFFSDFQQSWQPTDMVMGSRTLRSW